MPNYEEKFDTVEEPTEEDLVDKYYEYLDEFDNGGYSYTSRKRNKVNKKIKHKKTSLN